MTNWAGRKVSPRRPWHPDAAARPLGAGRFSRSQYRPSSRSVSASARNSIGFTMQLLAPAW